MNFEGKCPIKLVTYRNVSTIKQGNHNTAEPLLAALYQAANFYLAGSGQNPGKNCQLYTVIKTSIQWPPVLSGCSQLLAVPVVLSPRVAA